MNDVIMTEKSKRNDNSMEKCKKHRYEKSKLLELRKNKKCQEWPKVLNKRFIGMDGKWDPVGAFDNSTFSQRTHSRDDIQHVYNERYRKRQRDDYKYYYYGEGSKRYSSSYGSNYSRYYPSNSKQRYQYEDDIVYESSRNRSSPSEYYHSYTYQSSKSRSGNSKDHEENIAPDSKPEWFTGGPSNINETIELSGMSRELEAGILKNRKASRKNEDNYLQSKDHSPKTDANMTFSSLTNEANDDLDSHLMKIIKTNAKENDKRKSISTAKEVEKVLKSILLRPNEECQETASLSQNLNGVVRTVNEIEANLKIKGNRGAGDMSAYYKLLGLVQTGNDTNTNITETSTNNNHPRQNINPKYPFPNQTKVDKTPSVSEGDLSCKVEETTISVNNEIEFKENILSRDVGSDPEKQRLTSPEVPSTKQEDLNSAYIKQINGFNHYNNLHTANNALRNESLAMASRNMCNPLSSQFTNHMLGTGQMGHNAYRWIRAMNNAAAASARITQMNQQDYCVSNENNSDAKVDKQDVEYGIPMSESNSLDMFNANLDNNIRANIEQTNGANQMSNYINSLNLNNYMGPGSSLFSQLSMKPFHPFGYHAQSSMFGRQFLNPYILQQLFMHKQWENRNFSLQNQLRQFQSFGFNHQQNLGNAINNPNYGSSTPMPLNQGDCSAIGMNK